MLVLLMLIAYKSQNPVEWSPSRIVQGQIPEPAAFPISGDTWSISLWSFDLTHPLAFFDMWLSGKVIYIPLLIAAIIPLVLTIILGRVFCSWICPVGFLLEMNMKVHKLLEKAGITFCSKLPDLRYHILAVFLFAAFALAFPVLSVFDPPHTLGRELMNVFTHQQFSISGAGILIVLYLMDSFIASRACCSKLCPSGCGLGVLGKARLLRINMAEKKCIECGKCDDACPYQLAPMGLATGNKFDWLTCDNCGLCRDICPVGAITYNLTIKG